MLIVFGGLPGTGKSAIAKAIAKERRAVYLRIDAIEQVLRSSGVLAKDVGPSGYMVAYALAEANLGLGLTVVADSVNPLAITRDAWRKIAAIASTEIVEIEIICSDREEHRRRAETRSVDVPGLIAPSWAQILRHDYEPWDRPRIVLDTAHRTVEQSLTELRARIGTGPI